MKAIAYVLLCSLVLLTGIAGAADDIQFNRAVNMNGKVVKNVGPPQNEGDAATLGTVNATRDELRACINGKTAPYWFCNKNTGATEWKDNRDKEVYEPELFVIPLNFSDHSDNGTISWKLRMQSKTKEDGGAIWVNLYDATLGKVLIEEPILIENVTTENSWWESKWSEIQIDDKEIHELFLMAWTEKYDYHIERALLLVR